MQNQDFDAPAFDIEQNLNFLDDIDQYDAPDSCDKSVANSSNNSADSRSEKEVTRPSVNSNEKQMIMIDGNYPVNEPHIFLHDGKSFFSHLFLKEKGVV